MNPIGVATRSAYNFQIAEHSASRRGNRDNLGAPALINGAFFVRCPSIMAGDAGQAVRSGQVPSPGISTPASFAASTVESRSANSNSKTRSLAMNPVSSDALARPRLIDADRLTLLLEMLDYAASILPRCLPSIYDDEEKANIKNAITVFNMARAELHRLQGNPEEKQP